ncbi:MAG TPA: DNA primase [Cytophagaceae bacterium]
MSITKETIDKVREAADIVEVVGDFVSLKKRGQNYTACCPFHQEKTPSFSVHAAKGIYKCFGCGKAGDSIQFIMDIESLAYIEAIKFLGAKYGIEVEETVLDDAGQVRQSERDSLYIVLNFAKNYFKDLLLKHDEGQSIGYTYFKERGFSEETISKFDLGYSLGEWEGFTQVALKAGYSADILEKAGLILQRENPADARSKYYDRFRGRVIFPIHNLSGKVIAFGARILKAERNQPKYVNSPETEVYHKGNVLYGIHQAKQMIRQEDECYLVEGYTDVISLHQAGVQNVVASSGTALTEEQIKLVSRFTPNVTVLYDGDAAGIKASVRGIDLILEAGLNVHIVLFPDGEDPDSYSKKVGASNFKEFIKANRADFITFKTKLFLTEAQNDPLKKAEVIREIISTIAKIPDAIKRSVFIKECSKLLEVDEQILISENNKIRLNKGKEESKKPAPTPVAEDVEEVPTQDEISQNIIQWQEREIVRLLIEYASDNIDEQTSVNSYLLSEVEDIDFKTPVYKKIVDLLRVEKSAGRSVTDSFFIGHEDAEIRKEAIDLISSKYELSTNWEKFKIYVAREKDNLGQAIFTTILRLKWRNIQSMIKENQEHLQDSPSVEEMETCLKMHMKLKEAEKEIATLLGNVVSR